MWSALPCICLVLATAATVPRVGERYNYFNIDLLQSLFEKDDGNLIMSPASAKLALMILSEGMGGRTRQEVLSALRLPDDDALIDAAASRSLKTLQKNLNGTEVSATSRLWARPKLKISNRYTNIIREHYHTVIQQINFADSKASVNIINEWVRQATGQKIESLVDAGSVNSDMSLLLTSALYFKGQWQTSFDKTLTKTRCFYAPEYGCKNVSFMQTTSKLPYAYVTSLDAEVIGLPYSDGKTMMLIILPTHDETDQNLRILSKDLSYVPVSTLLSYLQETEVELHLPKFSIESKLDLQSSLIHLGIKDMFEMTANFSEISSDESLRVAGVVQNAKIELDEDGTIAAAVTGISIVPFISWSTQIFNANRPFIFMIVDRETYGTLFSGRFVRPI